jgi:2-phosphosulfolactate phosphatase
VIDVAFTRADVRCSEVAVVIDVLRATSTATQALAAGYRSVLCVASVEDARALGRPGRVLAGERRCVMPDGFRMGNSPIEALRVHGEELVLATTNGTPAILAAARRAGTVLAGCLLNLDAVTDALGRADDVQLVCSGTDGAVAFEDVFVAGRICERLDGARTDTARVAQAVARAHPTGFAALAASGHAATLRAAGMSDDVAFCSYEGVLDVVPRVTRATAGIATLAPAVDRAGTVLA